MRSGGMLAISIHQCFACFTTAKAFLRQSVPDRPFLIKVIRPWSHDQTPDAQAILIQPSSASHDQSLHG